MPTKREIKFYLIEKLLLPVGTLFVKALVSTYRMHKEDAARTREMTKDGAVLGTCHGCAISLMPYRKLARDNGRDLFVLSSPSRDGRLMATIVQSLGMKTIFGSSRAKSMSATKGLIRALKNGDHALITVDGPRGPRVKPKPGFLGIARLAGAKAFLFTTGCRYAIRLKSWDRMFIPLPFSTIRGDLRPVSIESDESEDAAIARIERELYDSASASGAKVIEDLPRPQ